MPESFLVESIDCFSPCKPSPILGVSHSSPVTLSVWYPPPAPITSSTKMALRGFSLSFLPFIMISPVSPQPVCSLIPLLHPNSRVTRDSTYSYRSRVPSTPFTLSLQTYSWYYYNLITRAQPLTTHPTSRNLVLWCGQDLPCSFP